MIRQIIVLYMVFSSIICFSQKSYAVYGEAVQNFKINNQVNVEDILSFENNEELVSVLQQLLGKPVDTTMIMVGNYVEGINFIYSSLELKYFNKYKKPELYELYLRNEGNGNNRINFNSWNIAIKSKTGNILKIIEKRKDMNYQLSSRVGYYARNFHGYPYYLEMIENNGEISELRLYYKID